jgi:peroxiredoxin
MNEEMLKPGTTAPDFKLASADGRRIRLSDYRGRPVLLCFWATPIYPDAKADERHDLQRIEKICSRYKDAGLVVLGYNANDDAKTALETMRANAITFPTVLDTSDEARAIRSQGYKVNGYVAKNYIIERTGKIMAAFQDKAFDEYDEPILGKTDRILQKVGGEVGEIAQRRVLASGSAEEVSAAAQRLFQAIRQADYNKDWSKPNDRRQFPAKDVSYGFRLAPKSWITWVCNKFKTNPIADVHLGKPFTDSEGRPTVHYRLTLKDGEILEGDLPFLRTRSLRGESWAGVEGLDWHLKKDLEKKP